MTVSERAAAKKAAQQRCNAKVKAARAELRRELAEIKVDEVLDHAARKRARETRHARALALRESGMTYAQIGAEFGISGTLASALVYRGREDRRLKRRHHAASLCMSSR